ncbi:MAG: glycosyltransferase family 4 protein [Verrucomicrobia bacterium]|nr:glycosyltransferase family 4 protein [Verrucomicrobiota bacterium]MBV9672306.1 glycosyltransferase family 4 protein [Verrucomicrobiota bacterium]
MGRIDEISDIDALGPAAELRSLRRILMTADAVGGVWTYSLDLAAGLQRRNVEIILAVMGPRPSEKQRQDARALQNLHLAESDFELEWMESPWESVDAAGNWLLELAAEREVDVIHLNGYSHARLPWNCPCLVAAHSCVNSWWKAVAPETTPPDLAEYTKRVAEGLNSASLVIAPTAAMLEMLKSFYLFSAPTRIIANGCSTASFWPAEKTCEIITIGRLWDEAKGMHFLDEVAQSVKWPIYAIGNTLHPAGNSVSASHLRTLGPLTREEIANRLRASAIYAAPAKYEPFGLAILEAALCGCALVLSDIPSLRENWHDSAILVDVKDHAAWEKALNQLIEMPAYRNELSNSARTRALELKPEEMSERYFDAYCELLLPAPAGLAEKSSKK